jgi:isoleucyl-tRNA synthetase
MGSAVKSGENLNVSEEDIADQNKRCLATFYNSYKYFITYANLHNFIPNQNLTASPNLLDQWIITNLRKLNILTEKYLQKYDIPHAVRLLRPFIDELSTWYIRQNRDRFVEWKS